MGLLERSRAPVNLFRGQGFMVPAGGDQGCRSCWWTMLQAFGFRAHKAL